MRRSTLAPWVIASVIALSGVVLLDSVAEAVAAGIAIVFLLGAAWQMRKFFWPMKAANYWHSDSISGCPDPTTVDQSNRQRGKLSIDTSDAHHILLIRVVPRKPMQAQQLNVGFEPRNPTTPEVIKLEDRSLDVKNEVVHFKTYSDEYKGRTGWYKPAKVMNQDKVTWVRLGFIASQSYKGRLRLQFHPVDSAVHHIWIKIDVLTPKLAPLTSDTPNSQP